MHHNMSGHGIQQDLLPLKAWTSVAVLVYYYQLSLSYFLEARTDFLLFCESGRVPFGTASLSEQRMLV